MRLTKRKLIIGLIACAVMMVGIGASVMPASAEQRTLLVTLVTGQTLTVTVDVPPGTPIDQIKIPGITTPIASVSEVPQEPAPPPPPAGGSGEQPPPPAQDPAQNPAAPAPAAATASSPQQSAQETTGKAKRKAKDKVEGSKDKVAGAVNEATGTANVDKDKPRQPDGAPTAADPTFSLALPGPAPIGVPNFFIEKFRIPPFLLPIYQAAGIEYGVRWEVLAAINEIETDYGRNLNVSTAGAVGWMQFLPSTWKKWGVDAN